MADTILLADDSLVIQKLVGLSLANQDVEIVTTDNGLEAIEMARAHHPSVILADVVMPGLSGYEVCSAIKNDPTLADIPVILLTRTSESFNEDLAHQIGADGHITKPFESQTLATRVLEILGRSETASISTHIDEATNSYPGASADYPLQGNGDTSVLAHTSNHELLIEPLTQDEYRQRSTSEEKEELPPLSNADWNATIESRELLDSRDSTHHREAQNWPGADLESAIEALLDEDPKPVAPEPENPPLRQTAETESDIGSQPFDWSRTEDPNPDDRTRTREVLPDATPGRDSELSASAQAQIREVVERVAWEAFSDLPQAIVRSLMERVERVAWEVIPQMAEVLIREEIQRMKANTTEDDPGNPE